MSYDVYVQDIPVGARSVTEIPDGFVPQPIGSRSFVMDAIRKAAPEAKFPKPEWGSIEADDYLIEISLSLDDPVESSLCTYEAVSEPRSKWQTFWLRWEFARSLRTRSQDCSMWIVPVKRSCAGAATAIAWCGSKPRK